MTVCGTAAKKESALGRVLLGRVFISPAVLNSDRENEARLVAWMEGVVRGGMVSGELRADVDVDGFLYLCIVLQNGLSWTLS